MYVEIGYGFEVRDDVFLECVDDLFFISNAIHKNENIPDKAKDSLKTVIRHMAENYNHAREYDKLVELNW